MSGTTSTTHADNQVDLEEIRSRYPDLEIWEGEVQFSDVIIDHKIQRPVQARWVARHRRQFNPSALGTVQVAVRADGTMSLLDGLQRKSLCDAVGYNEPVRALFYKGLSPTQEAELFLEFNDRTSLNAVDEFRALVAAGDPLAIQITNVVESYGLQVRIGTGFAAIKTAIRICKKPGGVRGFGFALAIINKVWGVKPENLDGRLIEALAAIYVESPWLDVADLERKLAGHKGAISGILGDARTVRELRHGAMLDCICDVLVGIYNKGLRIEGKKLPEWKRKRSS